MSLFGRSRQGGDKSTKSAAKAKDGDATISRVRVDSGYYTVAALDSGRVTIAGLDKDFIRGQRIHFSFVLRINGQDVEIPTHGTVRRVNGDQVTTTFLAPQPYYLRLLKKAAASHPNPPQRQPSS